MSHALVQDYLQTQGLRLPKEEVEVARATLLAILQAVENIDLDVDPWFINEETAQDPVASFFQLREHLPKNEQTILLAKAIFAMLDSIAERHSAEASVYLRPQHNPAVLMRLAQLGAESSNHLPMLEAQAKPADALFTRAAETGWANIIENVEQWIEWGDAPKELLHYGKSHLALPITNANGSVLGLLTVSQAEESSFNPEAQAWWIALAVVLAEILPSYLPEGWLHQSDMDENE